MCIIKEVVSVDEIQKTLLAEVADLHGVPAGAYNKHPHLKAVAISLP